MAKHLSEAWPVFLGRLALVFIFLERHRLGGILIEPASCRRSFNKFHQALPNTLVRDGQLYIFRTPAL